MRKLIYRSSPHNFIFSCLIFAVDFDREIILTAKFSQSLVVHYAIGGGKHWKLLVHKQAYNIGLELYFKHTMVLWYLLAFFHLHVGYL